MFVWEKVLPVFSPEGDGATAPAAEAPPAEGGSESLPTEGVGESDSMKFVLEAFDPMMSDLEEEEIGAMPPMPESGVQPATPPVQTAPVQQPAQAPATPAPVPVAPQVPVAQPSASAQPSGQPAGTPPAPVQALEPSKILDQIAENVAAQQEVFTKALAEQQYSINAKDAEALGFMPEQTAAVSQLLAKTHVNVVSSMTQMMAKQLPVMIHGLLEARERTAKAEGEFFNAWPQLKGEEKQATLKQVMSTYRQMNPNADKDSFIKTTGAMACAILGLPIQNPTQGQQPAAPQVRTPGPVVRANPMQAFQPAGVNTAPPNAQAQPQLSEWDRLARIISADDQGAFDR